MRRRPRTAKPWRGAEKALAEEGTPRALTHDEVEHYRLTAKVATLMEAVLLLADEVDRLKGTT